MTLLPAFFVATIFLVVSIGRATASSQFENDASFSIIDTDLSTIFSSGSTTVPNEVTTEDMTTLAPLSTTGNPYSQRRYNPLKGFDDPPPVHLSGDALDPASGIFTAHEDGHYVFMVQKVGRNEYNPDLFLTVFPGGDHSSNVTLANLIDTGNNALFTMTVLVQLNRDDEVFISNRYDAEVRGDDDNPFIYNAFLLYHTPITPFPKVRQSAFSVSVPGNLSVEEQPFSDYNTPTVNINQDFDVDSGVFSVPMRGLYIFHLSVTFEYYGMPVQRPAVSLRVNGEERASVQARFETLGTKSAGVTIAQELKQNDEVQLVNVNEASDVYCLATFVGYLLA